MFKNVMYVLVAQWIEQPPPSGRSPVQLRPGTQAKVICLRVIQRDLKILLTYRFFFFPHLFPQICWTTM